MNIQPIDAGKMPFDYAKNIILNYNKFRNGPVYLTLEYVEDDVWVSTSLGGNEVKFNMENPNNIQRGRIKFDWTYIDTIVDIPSEETGVIENVWWVIRNPDLMKSLDPVREEDIPKPDIPEPSQLPIQRPPSPVPVQSVATPQIPNFEIDDIDDIDIETMQLKQQPTPPVVQEVVANTDNVEKVSNVDKVDVADIEEDDLVPVEVDNGEEIVPEEDDGGIMSFIQNQIKARNEYTGIPRKKIGSYTHWSPGNTVGYEEDMYEYEIKTKDGKDPLLSLLMTSSGEFSPPDINANGQPVPDEVVDEADEVDENNGVEVQTLHKHLFDKKFLSDSDNEDLVDLLQNQPQQVKEESNSGDMILLVHEDLWVPKVQDTYFVDKTKSNILSYIEMNTELTRKKWLFAYLYSVSVRQGMVLMRLIDGRGQIMQVQVFDKLHEEDYVISFLGKYVAIFDVDIKIKDGNIYELYAKTFSWIKVAPLLFTYDWWSIVRKETSMIGLYIPFFPGKEVESIGYYITKGGTAVVNFPYEGGYPQGPDSGVIIPTVQVEALMMDVRPNMKMPLLFLHTHDPVRVVYTYIPSDFIARMKKYTAEPYKKPHFSDVPNYSVGLVKVKLLELDVDASAAPWRRYYARVYLCDPTNRPINSNQWKLYLYNTNFLPHPSERYILGQFPLTLPKETMEFVCLYMKDVYEKDIFQLPIAIAPWMKMPECSLTTYLIE